MNSLGSEAVTPASRCDAQCVQSQAERLTAAGHTASVLNAINIPVFVLNRQRQIVLANAMFHDLAGLDALADPAGMRLGNAIQCVHEDDRSSGQCGSRRACAVCDAMLAILRGLNVGRDERRCTLALKDGGAMNALFRTTRLDIDGEPFIICALLDIKDSLWHREVQGTFLHDLFNIASSIRSTAEALPQFPVEMQREYLDRIRVATDAMLEEIESQRLLIQAEDGMLQLRTEPIRTCAFLETMRLIIAQHDVSRDRILMVAPSARDVELETDRGILSRVLINLIKNALEASAPGQAVTLETGGDGQTVFFSVHNEQHIPSHVASGIFSRFFSTRGRGRGIGTYSARLLTERYLGGTIGFTTDPVAGTRFTVTYPAQRS